MLSSLAPHVSKLKYLLNENSSTIFTGLAIVGTTATAYLTAKATFKAADLIAEEKSLVDHLIEENVPPTKLSKMEQTSLVWKMYIPPAAAGVFTIGCIITANRITSKKIAALVAAAGVSERALTEYKEKVIEKLGPKQDQRLQDEIAQDRVTANPLGSQVLVAGTGEVLCYDMTTGRYFQSTMEEIKTAENKVNYELIHYNSCSLSFFYEEIGLPPTPYTDSVGWNMGNHMEVKFSTVLAENNKPCLAIDFSRPPISDYDKNPY